MKRIKNFNLILLLALFSFTGTMIVRSFETVPQTQTILKSYFVTGAHPSSTNYAELIDTTFWYILQTYTNAQAAAASAAAAQGVWQFVVDQTVVGSGSTVTNSINNLANVTSVTVTNVGTLVGLKASGGTANYTIYKFNTVFANPLDGTNYHANFSFPAAASTAFSVFDVHGSNPNSETQPLFFVATNFTTTNFVFYFACFNASQISGLRIKYTGQ